MSTTAVARRLLIGLIVLVLLLIMQLVLRRVPDTGNAREEAREESFLVDIERKEEIESLEIETAERVLRLERNGDAHYRIALENGAIPARRSRVDSILEAVLSLDRSSVVTENPDRHDSLRVSPGETPFVRGYDYRLTLDGRTIGQREVFVGVSTESPHLYVRLAGEDSVYRNRDRLSFYLDQDPVYWAELRLFADAASIDEVARMRLTEVAGTGQVSLTRATDARVRFDREEDDAPDYPANEELVRRVLSLEGVGFMDDEIAEAAWRIEIRLDDGRAIEATIGRQRRGVYPAGISDGEAHVTSVSRPTIALRPELFEAVLERLDG